MIYGNWVGIHKGFIKHLPVDRPYTELEAMFSLSVDSDNKRDASISGYSKLWSWSRNKVRKFLSDTGVEIIYPEDVSKKQNQKGQIQGQIRDRSGTDKGQIRFIIDKALHVSKDRSGTDQGQIKDRSEDSTIDPINPNPDPKKKYLEDSNEFRLSLFLLNHIRKNKPDYKEPNLQTWAKHADLLLRKDKRDIEEVKRLIAWVQSDDFEQVNVLSMSKLKKRYDSLVMKMNKKPSRNQHSEKTLSEIAAEMDLPDSFDIELTDYEEVD